MKIVKLDVSTRDDFFRVHCDENDAGWCNCIAWWVPTWDGWGDRTSEQNKKLRCELFDKGEYDGYLIYVDGVPAAWCQVGKRDRLQKLTRQFKLDADPEMWAITCFFVIPKFRKQGVAKALLGGVLDDLKKSGVKRVQAFPKRGEKLDAGDMWTGPEALFASAGFKVLRDSPTSPVMEIRLE